MFLKGPLQTVLRAFTSPSEGPLIKSHFEQWLEIEYANHSIRKRKQMRR